MFGERFIMWLKKHQAKANQYVLMVQKHAILTKAGTPTMGGLLILGSFILATLLGPLSNQYLWPVLLIASSFGVIGATDDWLKLKRRSSDGMSGRRNFSSSDRSFSGQPDLLAITENLRYGVQSHSLKTHYLSRSNLCAICNAGDDRRVKCCQFDRRA